MNKSLIAVFSVGLVGMSSVALADNSYAVSYSQKELTSAQGVQAVHARIVREAKRHCPDYSTIRRIREVTLCVEEVVSDLVDKVNHPELSRYHANDEGYRIASEQSRPSDAG